MNDPLVIGAIFTAVGGFIAVVIQRVIEALKARSETGVMVDKAKSDLIRESRADAIHEWVNLTADLKSRLADLEDRLHNAGANRDDRLIRMEEQALENHRIIMANQSTIKDILSEILKVSSDVGRIEKATNSMHDKMLVSSHEAGVIQGTAEEKAKNVGKK